MNNQTWCALSSKDREDLVNYALSLVFDEKLDTRWETIISVHISEHVGIIWDKSLEVATADYTNTGLSVGAVFERSIKRLITSYAISFMKTIPTKTSNTLKITAVLMGALGILMTASLISDVNRLCKSETTGQPKMIFVAKSET